MGTKRNDAIATNRGAIKTAAWRKTQGLTQKAAAERLGMTQSEYGRFELAQRIPTSFRHVTAFQRECGIEPAAWASPVTIRRGRVSRRAA